MKKILNIILLAVLTVLSSCGSDSETITDAQSPQLFGVYQVNSGNGVLGKDVIVFTDLDIVSFNPATKEIKFKESAQINNIPIYSEIVIKHYAETLFTITAYINSVVSRAYDDLVLFRDVDGKYYLNDNYPDYWKPEETKKNADKRSDGWNKFLKILKDQGRIK
ncbi:MAG: hypothetical protein K2G76_05880 [Prevotella sp.]|nr:hypothetical protein [Prevotella sp.]